MVGDDDEGVREGEECRRGLKMRTTIRPKMISNSKKIHFRLPVFFWYLHDREPPDKNYRYAFSIRHYSEAEQLMICNAPRRHIQLFNGLGHLDTRLFDVIFHTI